MTNGVLKNESQQRLDAANTQVAQLQVQLRSSKKSHEEGSKELLEQLRQDLAHAQQEAETLRTTVSINAPPTNASLEEGGQSFAEQVTERVETIRAQLESQHSQRVKEADEMSNKRIEGMKKNLVKRLVEGKEQARQQLQAEYDQEMQRLKTEHEQKIEALKAQHQAEIDELKRTETTRAEQPQQQGLVKHASQPSARAGDVKSEPQASEWQPTEEQLRNLIATNGQIKNMLSGNIKRRVDSEREAIVASHKEELQKLLDEKLQDAESKAVTAKEQAVLMEGKRYGVKISMTENRFKAAQAKIEIVQKAATDTPERPVAEVWAIAKDAKPPPAASQPARQADQTGQTIPQTAGKPTPAMQASLTQSPTVQGTFGQPTPPQGQSRPPSVSQMKPVSASLGLPGQTQPPQQFPSANPFAQPLQQAPIPPNVMPPNVMSPNIMPSNVMQLPSIQQPPSTLQQGSNLPAKPPQAQMGQRPIAGTGPAISRGPQQSGLPVARGAARGGVSAQQSHIPQGPQGQPHPAYQHAMSNIARGRGRGGIGRGAPPPVTTHVAQAGPPAQASPGSATGGLNAGAKQFVPVGNKRAREDGQEGGDPGSGGKRIRGGGPES